MSINVENYMLVYRENGKDTGSVTKKLCVKSGSWNDRVILCYEGMEIEVLANDLHAAINNAVNTGRR